MLEPVQYCYPPLFCNGNYVTLILPLLPLKAEAAKAESETVEEPCLGCGSVVVPKETVVLGAEVEGTEGTVPRGIEEDIIVVEGLDTSVCVELNLTRQQ